MPQSVSETSLVSSVSPIHLENAEIVLQDEIEDTVLDVEEYTCTNRELVNLENAAVNIDNSNDVIIGPVTQFNVNGNVTIFQNGTRESEAINGTVINNNEEPYNKSPVDAKLGKFGKTDSEDQDIEKLNKQKKYIKIISSIAFALLILIGITVTVIFCIHKFEDDSLSPIPDDTASDDYLGTHQILDRTKWNGRPPLSYRNITSPVRLVVIKHTAGGTCSSFQECAGKVQTIQSQAVTKGASDIYYSFLIGGDENIYIGRGWDVQPQQRDNIIDIAFLGSYAFDVPSHGMMEAVKMLIQDGAKNSKLTEDYKVVCHNQTAPTESPGVNLYKEVRKLPHYDSGLYFN